MLLFPENAKNLKNVTFTRILSRLGLIQSDSVWLGRIQSDSVRLGRRIQSDSVRLGRTWSDSVRLGRIQSDWVGFSQTGSDFDFGKFCRIRSEIRFGYYLLKIRYQILSNRGFLQKIDLFFPCDNFLICRNLVQESIWEDTNYNM